jgi:putative transposase
VVADCYLAGVSTRRVDTLVKTPGIDSLSKSQVSRMAADLDEHVDEFRHRPLECRRPVHVGAVDALAMKVRKGGRVINAVVLLATGVNGDGHLGLHQLSQGRVDPDLVQQTPPSASTARSDAAPTQ